jgi:transposase
MYIRQTKTKTSTTDENYTTFRIVDGVRDGSKVKQRTLLNLGKYFDLPPEMWGRLCSRIDEILKRRQMLPGFAEVWNHPDVEKYAQQFAARIIAKRATEIHKIDEKPEEYIRIIPDSLEMSNNRTVGVEHVGIHAINKLEIERILASLGFTKKQINQATALIIGRMAAPGSEASTWEWLLKRSSLGELLDENFDASSIMSLYRISDKLIDHQENIENMLYANAASLFGIQQTVTLYDLTNTFFEGPVTENTKAARGFSKEKRSDCPLVTLGLVLDGQGFVRKSKTFAGNASEGDTLQSMLKQLGACPEAMVVMDRGIATKANLEWLTANKYKYLVVSRERLREFDFSKAQTIQTARSDDIQIYKEINEEGTEARLYCYSPKREGKELGIVNRFMKKYESGLAEIAKSLEKPHGNKVKDKIMQRIGKLQEKTRGICQHYEITVTDNALEKKPGRALLATSITWEKKLVDGSMAKNPGVYVIRSNELSFDAEKLWKTYIMLTDVEAVFRSLKSELGLRPVFHRKTDRADGHLFVSVLAYQCVQTIRKKLKEQGIDDSWVTLRTHLSQHTRATGSFRQADGGTLHIRKAMQPPSDARVLYHALRITDRPGGIKKYIN